MGTSNYVERSHVTGWSRAGAERNVVRDAERSQDVVSSLVLRSGAS